MDLMAARSALPADSDHDFGAYATPRWIVEPDDVVLLERMFELEQCPGREMREQLAACLKVKPRQIQVWFQNKRQRRKNRAKPTRAESIAHASLETNTGSQMAHPAELLRILKATKKPSAERTSDGAELPPGMQCLVSASELASTPQLSPWSSATAEETTSSAPPALPDRPVPQRPPPDGGATSQYAGPSCVHAQSPSQMQSARLPMPPMPPPPPPPSILPPQMPQLPSIRSLPPLSRSLAMASHLGACPADLLGGSFSASGADGRAPSMPLPAAPPMVPSDMVPIAFPQQLGDPHPGSRTVHDGFTDGSNIWIRTDLISRYLDYLLDPNANAVQAFTSADQAAAVYAPSQSASSQATASGLYAPSQGAAPPTQHGGSSSAE